MVSGNILIIGAARSGIGVAILGKSKGLNVLLVDDVPISQKNIEELKYFNISYISGNLSLSLLKGIDMVVKSPGVPANHFLVQEANRTYIPVIGEIEFASFFTGAKLIGITGTNGKTTTTYLTYHILKNAGLSVSMAGNVGKSFALAVMDERPDYFVLELSSFQLEDMYKVRLDIACVLNITPDHLDRHITMDGYIAAKFRVLQNMKSSDYFIYNGQDHNTRKFLENKTIVPRLCQLPIDLEQFFLSDSLPGAHNKINVEAATTIARILKIDRTVVRKSLKTFLGVPHRIQKVATIDGVTFYNDSKATNIDSARVALESFSQRIIWIAGGYDKGNDYTEISDLVKEKVKAIVCLTKNYEKFIKTFSKVLPICITESVDDAVKKSFSFASNGDVVLLSPACASFDLFDNYEHRGNEYMKAIDRLIRKKKNEDETKVN